MRSYLQRILFSGKSFRNILIAGIIVRLFFVFIGGKIYYCKKDYYEQGDSPAWFGSFVNLVETGTYTVNPSVENGKFFRPPGYAFLFGIFYLLSFKNYLLAEKLLVALQVLLDIICIWLISRIAERALKNSVQEKQRKYFSNCAALLYAFYPFVIVWAPVLYAESASVFFLLLSIYFALQKISSRSSLYSGIAGGIAVLMRLQCIFMLPFVAVVISAGRDPLRKKIRSGILFFLGILFTYGLWPARNYFLQHRLILSQDLNVGTFWSPDYMAFMDYVFAVQTDYNSVYNDFMHGEKVRWPEASYLIKEDIPLLDSVTSMCSRCGTGFRYFMIYEGLRSDYLHPDSNCDEKIAAAFRTLTLHQKKYNKLNYWLNVPLHNLQKALFKLSLYDAKKPIVKMLTTALFLLRSLLIILGLAGLYLGIRNRFFRKDFLALVTGYVVSWYLILSFFYRNMEIRYLLQADVLLLIPAAYVCYLLLVNKNPQVI